ncbi:MAG: hypothetical protein AAF291_12090 [Pseudomonadota bacterium]
MTRKLGLTLALVSLALSPTAVHAASKQDKKMMKLIAQCAYVVKMAEGNGVKLRNSAATWEQATANVAMQLKLDPVPYINEARAKYKKRERVMGSGDAVRSMIARAKECDAQL